MSATSRATASQTRQIAVIDVSGAVQPAANTDTDKDHSLREWFSEQIAARLDVQRSEMLSSLKQSWKRCKGGVFAIGEWAHKSIILPLCPTLELLFVLSLKVIDSSSAVEILKRHHQDKL